GVRFLNSFPEFSEEFVGWLRQLIKKPCKGNNIVTSDAISLNCFPSLRQFFAVWCDTSRPVPITELCIHLHILTILGTDSCLVPRPDASFQPQSKNPLVCLTLSHVERYYETIGHP